MATTPNAGTAAPVLQILSELGAEDSNLLLTTAQAVYVSFADKGRFDPRLQFLYAKRQMIDVLLGHTWQQVDVSAESAKSSLSQRFAALQVMRADCQAEIVQWEAQDRARRGSVIGPILKTSPTPARPGTRDPSDSYYRGDVLKRR